MCFWQVFGYKLSSWRIYLINTETIKNRRLNPVNHTDVDIRTLELSIQRSACFLEMILTNVSFISSSVASGHAGKILGVISLDIELH